MHACEDIGTLAVSLGIENPDGDKVGLAGNTEGFSSGNSGDVRAMSFLIIIDRAGDEVSAPFGAALKFLENGQWATGEYGVGSPRISTYDVVDVDASVNNVNRGTLASTRIIGIFFEPWRSPVAVRNPIKSPRRADANGQVVGGDFYVLVNICYLFKIRIIGFSPNLIAN